MVQSVIHKLDGFPIQARKILMVITDDSPDMQQPQQNLLLAKKSCLIICDNTVMMAKEGTEKAKRSVTVPVGDSEETWSPLRGKNARELQLLKQDSNAISEKEGHLSDSCAMASTELFISDMLLSHGCDTGLDTADSDTDIKSPGGNTCEKEAEKEIHSWNKAQLCKTVEVEHWKHLRVEEGTTCEFDWDLKEKGEWNNGSLAFLHFTSNHFVLGLASRKELDDNFKRPQEFLQSTTNNRKNGQEGEKTLSHVGCGSQHLVELDANEKADVHNVINGIKLQLNSRSVMLLVPQHQEISLLHREKNLEGKQQCDGNHLREYTGQSSVHETSNKKYSCNCTTSTEDENIQETLSRSEKKHEQKVLNKIHERGDSDNCQSNNKYHTFQSCSDHNIEKLNFKPLCSEDPLQSLDQESKESRHTYTISSLRRKLFKTIILPGLFISDGGHADHVSPDSEDIPNCAPPSRMECVKTVHTASSPRHFKMDRGPSTRETAVKKRSKMHQNPSELSAEYKLPTQQKKKNKSNTFKLDPEERSAHVCTNQENLSSESPKTSMLHDEQSRDECVEAIETIVITEKIKTKCHGKKKKRRCQSSQRKGKDEPSVDKGDSHKSSKKQPDASEPKLASPGRSNDGNASAVVSGNTSSCLDRILAEPCLTNDAVTVSKTLFSSNTSLSGSVTEIQSTATGVLNLPSEDSFKHKSLFNEKDEKQLIEKQPQEPECSVVNEINELVSEEMHYKKLHKEVDKQKPHTHNRVPKLLQNVQAVIAPDDLESIILQCQFGGETIDSFVVWTKEGAVLTEEKGSTWDEGQVSFMITKVSSKDLGWYQCCFSNRHGSVSSEFHLTSDVLNELVPGHNHTVEHTEGVGEDVKCTPLLFKEDFVSEQFFGEDQWASILTEEVHFGEGMHRKAFRTKLLAGLLPLFNPGHPCVLKVHNAISYGTKNNEELLRKNYNLAVEECHVQNTAREYIKAYTAVAQSAEAFGEVPEIIPIYLVHRPTNDIPYATLEEELLGDFVKYSVRDGKEINLMRRDSEAGQKCCAFQHWVYEKTDGNLLVTDMQGVGMKLTDVGIATCKKGYKGFKGNCATSFIDQFKALHQCSKFCEMLGLTSLQASQQKPRRKVTVAKSKTQPVAKKNVFPSALKNTS